MPRVATKRGLFWGSGVMRNTGLNRTLDRKDRGEEWREARNFRRWLRAHPDFTLELAEEISNSPVPELVRIAPPRLSWIRRLWNFLTGLLTWIRK